jgi:O-acetyl-ADP-ribose deacetylase (regulator of RNase III)
VSSNPSRTIEGRTLELRVGDITTLDVDAIVNPANTALQLGGGVAGAIRRAGGTSIQAECDKLGGCPSGGAVITGGGHLPAKHVIHAVGPVWGSQSDEESDRLLGSACSEALQRARENGLASVALPSISTGIFGFPVERAAPILLGAARDHLSGETSVETVVFCLFDDATLQAYEAALADLLPD